MVQINEYIHMDLLLDSLFHFNNLNVYLYTNTTLSLLLFKDTESLKVGYYNPPA